MRNQPAFSGLDPFVRGMTSPSPSPFSAQSPLARFRRRQGHGRVGFTLVEMVVALTIIAVAFAFSVPMVRSLRSEQQARDPIIQLVRMAKEARLRAMREKRPYQVAFHAGGFVASRYISPYMQLAELNLLLQESESGVYRLNPNAEDNDSDLDGGAGETPRTDMPTAPPPPKLDDNWETHYELPVGTQYSIKYWHDIQETFVQGEVVKLWVFQPSGICQPLKLHLERPGVIFDVEFGALTADITREVSDIQ